MTTVDTNAVLNADDIKRKIKRMAIEIAERNADCDVLILAGVQGNGEVVAQNVKKELQQIISCSIELITIRIDKTQPMDASIDAPFDFAGKTIIVVDDVADTGRVLLFSLKPFLAVQPKSIQTLVLVERSHKRFPIHSDYVGLSIATTIKEHIRVKTENGNLIGAWLF